MRKFKHQCTYCGLCVIDQCSSPPHSCDHCGDKNFKVATIETPNYYDEAAWPLEIEWPDNAEGSD